MRKKSREMNAEWALAVMDRAPYMTVSMTDADGMPYAVPLSLARIGVVRITLTTPPVGKRKQYDANGEEMKYGRME